MKSDVKNAATAVETWITDHATTAVGPTSVDAGNASDCRRRRCDRLGA